MAQFCCVTWRLIQRNCCITWRGAAYLAAVERAEFALRAGRHAPRFCRNTVHASHVTQHCRSSSATGDQPDCWIKFARALVARKAVGQPASRCRLRSRQPHTRPSRTRPQSAPHQRPAGRRRGHGASRRARQPSSRSRWPAPGGGDLWGGEKRKGWVGARCALCHQTRGGCQNAAPAGREVSSAARPRPDALSPDINSPEDCLCLAKAGASGPGLQCSRRAATTATA